MDVKESTGVLAPLRNRGLVPSLRSSAVIALLVLGPPLLGSYHQFLLAKIAIFAIFGMSLNLLWGYTGLLSLGHAAFFGVGGYTAGILMVRYGIDSLWLAAPLSILLTLAVASLFGIVALRVSGVYFLIVTLALGELLVSLGTRVRFLTTSASAEGVIGITRPNLGVPGFQWSSLRFSYFALIWLVVSYFLIRRFIRSAFGRTLVGIRENEPRMEALGYNVWLHKYIAYNVAACFAGIAGMLSAYNNGIMYPATFGVLLSTTVLLMVIIGGEGTLFGPVLGAAIVIILETVASGQFPRRWPLVIGIAFVVSVMYAPGGLIRVPGRISAGVAGAQARLANVREAGRIRRAGSPK